VRIYIVILIYCNNVWARISIYIEKELVRAFVVYARPYKYIFSLSIFVKHRSSPRRVQDLTYPLGGRTGFTGKRWLRKRQVLSRNHIKTFRLKNSSCIYMLCVCVCVRVRLEAHSKIPLFFRARQPVRKSYTNLRPLCLRFAKPVKGVRPHRRSYARSSHTRRPRRWLF